MDSRCFSRHNKLDYLSECAAMTESLRGYKLRRQGGQIMGLLVVFQLVISCVLTVLESCSEGQLRCENGECVDMRLVCNGISECTDMTCCPTGCPLENSFCCRNGHCTHESWVCDGYDDCGDWSDEDGCYNSSCPNDRYLCEDESRCMASTHRCNGYKECVDGSDETNCGMALSTGAILGILFAICILFVMATVIVTLMTKNRESCLFHLSCCREDDTEDTEPGPSDDAPELSSYQLPPPYSEVSNNRAFIIHKETDPGSQDDQPPPPSYDSVSEGDFQELRVPNSAEVLRLQELMRHVAALRRSPKRMLTVILVKAVRAK